MYQSRIQNKKKRSDRFQKKRELEIPNENDGTYFGVVNDMLGNGRVRIFCEDGSLKTGRIRGSMRKSRGKTIIEKNDLVIIASRDFEDKLDILHKYTAEEISELIRTEILPEKIYKVLTESDFCKTNGDEDTIVFCEQITNTDSISEDERMEVDETASKNVKDQSESEDLDIDVI